jgi:hypothetical protein
MERWLPREPVLGSTAKVWAYVWCWGEFEFELVFRWALVNGNEPGTPAAPQAARGGDGGTGPMPKSRESGLPGA